MSMAVPPYHIGPEGTSTLASSSHMNGIGNLGGDLEDLGQGLLRESPVKGFVDVLQSHPRREAFEDQRNRQPGAANRQPPSQELRVSDDPLIVFVRSRLPVRHNSPGNLFKLEYITASMARTCLLGPRLFVGNRGPTAHVAAPRQPTGRKWPGQFGGFSRVS